MYFGSRINEKKITIHFAFNKLTKVEVEQLKQIFSIETEQELYFDEEPYIYYTVL